MMDIEFHEDDDFDDDTFLDCGLDLAGQCYKAGSEECDWECPHMAKLSELSQ